MSFKVPEKFRITAGRGASDSSYGNNGAFIVRLRHNQRFFVIASDGMGWEHVSVSRQDRAPVWDEMCQIKDLFWDGEDCVLQFHPPRSKYVNNHPHCLHLWRNPAAEIQMPDPFLVGLLCAFEARGEAEILAAYARRRLKRAAQELAKEAQTK